MTETYIKWFLDRGGELISNLDAHKISKFNNNWLVTCLDSKTGNEKINTKYLFLCAGAIGTPFLLKSSGIKKGIGSTLQMHPTIKAIAEFNDTINYKDMGVPIHQVKEFSPDISFGCSISSQQYLALAMLDNKKYLDRIRDNWEKMAIYYAMIKPKGEVRYLKFPFSKIL